MREVDREGEGMMERIETSAVCEKDMDGQRDKELEKERDKCK